MLFTKIKQLCIENKITITELERELKFGNGTIHKWDSVQPSIGKVIAVANHFKVPLESLITSDEIPSKESREMACEFEKMTEKQKSLVKCYISLIKSGETA